MEWPKEFEGHDFEFYGNEGWFRLKIYDNQPTKKAGTYAVGSSAEECIAEALRKLKLDRDDQEIVADEQAAVKRVLAEMDISLDRRSY
jgi:hypothetical protein